MQVFASSHVFVSEKRYGTGEHINSYVGEAGETNTGLTKIIHTIDVVG